jgi:hypothetical protein
MADLSIFYKLYLSRLRYFFIGVVMWCMTIASSVHAAALLFLQNGYEVVGNQVLEENTLTLGAALPGTKFLFVSDPSSDPIFSGNNVRGRYYVINASNQVVAYYYGEITRLVKTGSTAIACQFYVYPGGDSARRAWSDLADQYFRQLFSRPKHQDE